MDPEVRAALAEVRARGIAIILATGHILSDLRREAGDLRILDAIVAENGAAAAWGSEALKGTDDDVVGGEGP